MSAGLTCAHFIAGIPKHEEGYENEYREQSGCDNKPLLMGQLITLTFQKVERRVFGECHTLLYMALRMLDNFILLFSV